ncbi:TIM barrel protein [Parasphingorhabdus litoris]|uniref:TIM barrel protein n=1 Tax=Parasphingorhabdus litoris TaxID=394733 RepID=A0ABN1AY35_9SPHN|nr:TIM barrel protein [Parasphingorhabdus litoris]
MRDLALHQITMTQGGPIGLVRFAAKASLKKVCLFTATPLDAHDKPMFAIVEPSDKTEFQSLLADNDVSIINAEYFPIMPETDVTGYAAALELAAELGAKRAVTHIHEVDPTRIADQLSALCKMARDLGMEVGLEFTGFAKGCDSLEKAVNLHRTINQPNLKIAIDALHLFRTGGTLEQLKTVDPQSIGYAQICDGPHFRKSDDYIEEAMNRMIPGEGMFPLRAMIDLLGEHVDLDIEVPHYASGSFFDAENWALEAIAASKELLE